MSENVAHPTVAVAPLPHGIMQMMGVNAWFDFDGPGAHQRAMRAAFRLADSLRLPVFVTRRHEQGTHLLVPCTLRWERYARLARRFGADTSASDFAVRRGESYLRTSPRPYDSHPTITIIMPGAQVSNIDATEAAGLGAYLSGLANFQVATYPQIRPVDRAGGDSD